MKRNRLFLVPLAVAGAAVWLLVAPPRFWLNLTKSVDLSDPVGMGARLVDTYECRKCHRIAGRGSLTGPDLAGVSTRLNENALQLWLRNPGAIKSSTAMPNFKLSDSELQAILAYLGTLPP